MLSLTLPQIFLNDPTPSPQKRQAHKKEALPAQKGGLKSAGPCQNRLPGATPRGAKNVDFRKESGVKTRQIAARAGAERPNSFKTQKPA
jgi:hypothetical protein